MRQVEVSAATGGEKIGIFMKILHRRKQRPGEEGGGGLTVTEEKFPWPKMCKKKLFFLVENFNGSLGGFFGFFWGGL